MLSFELHVCLKMDTLIGFLTMKTAGTYLFRIEASWILSQSGGGLHPGLITRWVVPMNSHNFWQMFRYTVGDCMMPSHFRMLINWKVWQQFPPEGTFDHFGGRIFWGCPENATDITYGHLCQLLKNKLWKTNTLSMFNICTGVLSGSPGKTPNLCGLMQGREPKS